VGEPVEYGGKTNKVVEGERESFVAGRYAGECAGAGKITAEAARAAAAVRDRPVPFQARVRRNAGTQVMLLSWRKMQPNGPPDAIHRDCEFGLGTALGTPQCLVRLATDRARGVPVHLDLQAVDAPNCSDSASADHLE